MSVDGLPYLVDSEELRVIGRVWLNFEYSVRLDVGSVDTLNGVFHLHLKSAISFFRDFCTNAV